MIQPTITSDPNQQPVNSTALALLTGTPPSPGTSPQLAGLLPQESEVRAILAINCLDSANVTTSQASTCAQSNCPDSANATTSQASTCGQSIVEQLPVVLDNTISHAEDSLINVTDVLRAVHFLYENTDATQILEDRIRSVFFDADAAGSALLVYLTDLFRSTPARKAVGEILSGSRRQFNWWLTYITLWLRQAGIQDTPDTRLLFWNSTHFSDNEQAFFTHLKWVIFTVLTCKLDPGAASVSIDGIIYARPTSTLAATLAQPPALPATRVTVPPVILQEVTFASSPTPADIGAQISLAITASLATLFAGLAATHTSAPAPQTVPASLPPHPARVPAPLRRGPVPTRGPTASLASCASSFSDGSESESEGTAQSPGSDSDTSFLSGEDGSLPPVQSPSARLLALDAICGTNYKYWTSSTWVTLEKTASLIYLLGGILICKTSGAALIASMASSKDRGLSPFATRMVLGTFDSRDNFDLLATSLTYLIPQSPSELRHRLEAEEAEHEGIESPLAYQMLRGLTNLSKFLRTRIVVDIVKQPKQQVTNCAYTVMFMIAMVNRAVLLEDPSILSHESIAGTWDRQIRPLLQDVPSSAILASAAQVLGLRCSAPACGQLGALPGLACPRGCMFSQHSTQSYPATPEGYGAALAIHLAKLGHPPTYRALALDHATFRKTAAFAELGPVAAEKGRGWKEILSQTATDQSSVILPSESS